MKLSFITDRYYREEKILSWVGIWLLIFVTSFIWMPKRDGLQAIFALGFLFPVLMVLPFRRFEFQNYGGWMTFLALIFAGYSTLTSFWAPISKPDFFIIQFVVLSVWLMGIAWYASQRNINWQRLQNYLLVIGSLIGLVSLIVFYRKNSWFSRLEMNFVADNPNEVGALFGILTLIAFCQWLRVNKPLLNIYHVILTLLLFAPLIASQSRGAFLAFVVTAVMAIFYLRPSKYKLILISAVGFVAAVIFFYSYTSGLLTADRVSAGFRDIIWQEVFSRSVNEHLWFGLGMEKFQKIIIPDVDVFDHAHNVWLDTFYHTGLVGLILGLTHVFFVLQKFKPSSTQITLYLWLMFSLIAGMFDYRTFFWQIDFKWFLFWVPVGLISAIQIQEGRVKEAVHLDQKT